MKIVLLGSRGNIANPLSKLLVSKGADVTVITRSQKNVDAIESDGAKAAVGSVDDVEFLTKTFDKATSVFIQIPANLFEKNALKTMIAQCNKVCDAVLKAGVKHVVYLSGIGSDIPEVGFHSENELILKNKLAGLDSVYLVRPSDYFANFLRNIDSIKKDGAIYSNTPKEQVESYVHPIDVAEVCSGLLFSPGNDMFKIINVEGDFASGEQVEKLLMDAIHIPVKWVHLSDADASKALVSAGMPEENVMPLLTIFSETYHNGITNFIKKQGSVYGKHKLADYFKKEFAAEYNK